MQYTAYTNHTFAQTPYYAALPPAERMTFDLLAQVFHFKVNRYVCEHLIDWEKVPEDPIYRFVFPRREMLAPRDFAFLQELARGGIDERLRQQFVAGIRRRQQPRYISAPGSLPRWDGEPITGMYRNFPTIVSLFPDPMVKTCHAYCSYCFRWIMFNNRKAQQSSSYRDPRTPVPWLRAHPEVSDVLFTGADPLVLKARTLEQYIAPILDLESVQVIRISSKSLAWWPYRFTRDPDADNLLRLFAAIRARGKHLNLCVHFTHPRELAHPEVARAVDRIRETGAVIRTQGPLIRNVNDDPGTWSRLWTQQVALGMVPYYMFMEADHHPQSCFRVRPARALRIFQAAQATTTGLARTVRGPVFMYDLNRVLLDGTTTVNGQTYFVLKTLQSPPGTPSEGHIKLLPYDEKAQDLGNLYELFNQPSPNREAEPGPCTHQLQ
ncbi:MAG: lysine 2,3-aminomutase [Bacteroidota bacterium]